MQEFETWLRRYAFQREVNPVGLRSRKVSSCNGGRYAGADIRHHPHFSIIIIFIIIIGSLDTSMPVWSSGGDFPWMALLEMDPRFRRPAVQANKTRY